MGWEADAITTTSQMPSSMAAAARHTMPAGVAPPRSTRSAKSTDQPQYSATVAGTNCWASKMSAPTTSPPTSRLWMPASRRASAARPAHCSRVSCRSPLKRRSDLRSA